MNEADETMTPKEMQRKLAVAIREVKNAAADRDDVVIEMREAERMRLELLAAELAPVIAEVPADADLFDFAISSGLQPRFWIDAVSHVGMGRDKRTFRFVKDTRLGRIVLAESTDMKTVANQVTRYLAERIVERERFIEGDITDLRKGRTMPAIGEDDPPPTRTVFAAEGDPTTVSKQPPRKADSAKSFLGGLFLVLAGAAVGLGIAVGLYWEKLGIDLGRFGLQ